MLDTSHTYLPLISGLMLDIPHTYPPLISELMLDTSHSCSNDNLS